jgi:hypothetical protein
MKTLFIFLLFLLSTNLVNAQLLDGNITFNYVRYTILIERPKKEEKEEKYEGIIILTCRLVKRTN